jgi:hypothetical protein
LGHGGRISRVLGPNPPPGGSCTFCCAQRCSTCHERVASDGCCLPPSQRSSVESVARKGRGTLDATRMWHADPIPSLSAPGTWRKPAVTGVHLRAYVQTSLACAII